MLRMVQLKDVTGELLEKLGSCEVELNHLRVQPTCIRYCSVFGILLWFTNHPRVPEQHVLTGLWSRSSTPMPSKRFISFFVIAS
jgi:hypothetical protein